MQAIILAGGKGTRLKPYTVAIPKPLVPVGDVPILEIIIRQLKYYKIDEVIISTGYLARLIEAYFGKGDKFGIKIRYIKESKALGTAGAIKNVGGLDDNFMVMNGDVLTDINYKKVFDFHMKYKIAATIATVTRDATIDFGVIEMDKYSRLIDYIEKPKQVKHVSMGINILSKKCKKYISKGESIGIPELILRMKTGGEEIRCFRANAYWLDIGRIEDFQIAQTEFAKNKKKFLYGQR